MRHSIDAGSPGTTKYATKTSDHATQRVTTPWIILRIR